MQVKLMKKRTCFNGIILMTIIVMVAACSGQSGQRAGQGAATGAVAGAAGGMVSALIFGGNVGEAAARGAVWGGTAGAVSGAMVGAQEDQAMAAQKAEQQKKAHEKLKQRLGEDAFSGLAALVDCKHEVALAYANTAKKDAKKDYSLAGLWLEILVHADQRKEAEARALFPELIEKDPEINSDTKAEESMRKAMQGLMNIRGEYNLPKTCS